MRRTQRLGGHAVRRLREGAQELTEGKRGRVLLDTVIARLAASQDTNVDSTLQQTIHQLVLLFIVLFAPTTPGSLSSGMKAFAENPEQVELLRTGQVSADDAAKFEQGGLADGVSNAWIRNVTPSGLPHSNQVCLSRKRHT